MLRFICFLSVILSVRCALAPFIKPCKSKDNACVLESAQAAVPYIAPGIPELGIKSLDPMHLDVIKSNQGGLELAFTNTTLTGMKGCIIEGIKNDLSKNKQVVTIRCTVELNGNYKLSGSILVLPIQGQGKYTIHIRDIVIKTFSDIATVPGADGKAHWHISNWRHTYQVKTGADFNFDNLFNGNKILGDPVQQFVNTNWRDVMQEIAPPIVRAIVSSVVDAVQALYKSVPAAELFVE